MSPKKKRQLMIRRHISAPEGLWLRIEALARADGRSVTELVRRLLINHLRREESRLVPEEQGELPNVARVGHYRRASEWLPPTAPLPEPKELRRRTVREG